MGAEDLDYQGFDWDEANETKIRTKHGLAREAVEGMFQRAIFIKPDEAHSIQERRWIAVGQDDHGRPMAVIFTLRMQEGQRRLRPISARRMHAKEAQYYEQS
jgi:uncharacterized DUF497 family protein